MPFALMPFLSVAFVNVCHTYAPTAARLPAFISTRVQYFTTPEGTFQVHAFGAVSEVMVTFMSPLLVVVQGYRAALLGFLFLQYVARRYKANPQTSLIVGLLVERLDGIAQHRFVPSPVHALYRRAKSAVGFIGAHLGN
jgi:hypothetical protein